MNSPSDAPRVLGRTEPRLLTPPLVQGLAGPCGCGCALTEETSYGFDVEWFAENVIGIRLDPWERYTVIHGGELLPDGRPRFRTLLVLVARQNGKTTLLRILTLYWLYVEHTPLVLGLANMRGYARIQWEKVVKHAEYNRWLRPRTKSVRRQLLEECLTTTKDSEYRIASANEDAGRSLTVSRLIADEIRSHKTWVAWNAAYNAMNAVYDAQAWAITNQGDMNGVVLKSLREAAIAFIDTGIGDPRLGLIEYSAPEGSDPEDLHALAMANPNLNYIRPDGSNALDQDNLLGPASRAKRAGGEELTGFLTENMCIYVKLLNPAIEPGAWLLGLQPGTLDDHRNRVTLCFDVARNNMHATVYAAAVMPDMRVRISFIQDWSGLACTHELRKELPGLVARIKPRSIGWLPNGPAAALAADMAERPGWPPAGVTLEEVKSDLPAVCMGFSELVTSGQLVHSGDPLLDGQIQTAEWYTKGDVKVFSRKGLPCDALYAAAGAVHLARTLPAPFWSTGLIAVP